jgi:hypothetical protein
MNEEQENYAGDQCLCGHARGMHQDGGYCGPSYGPACIMCGCSEFVPAAKLNGYALETHGGIK